MAHATAIRRHAGWGDGVLQLILDMGMGVLIDALQWIILWLVALP